MNKISVRSVHVLLLAVAVPITVGLTVLTLVLVQSSPRSAFVSAALAVLFIIFGVAAILLPTDWLPAASLLVFALAPKRLLPDALGDIHPASILVLVWVVRRLLSGESRGQSSGNRRTFVLGIIALAWMVVSTAFSIDVGNSLVWMGVFVCTVICVIGLGLTEREASLLTKCWLVAGSLLGLYAVVEAALRRNPIYGPIYNLFGDDGQHWETYRSTATLGHPLFAGMFLAVAASMAVSRLIEGFKVSRLFAAVACIAGMLATLSRGAILALAIATLFGFALAVSRNARRRLTVVLSFTGLAIVGFAFVSLSPSIMDRFSSDEATGSLDQRVRTIGIVAEALQGAVATGGGPGNAALSLGDQILSLRYIENSFLQILLGVGIIGLLLVLAFVASAFAQSWKRGDTLGVMQIVAFIVAIAGYNALDDQRVTITLLGLVLALSMDRTTGRTASQVPLKFETASTSRPVAHKVNP